MVLTLLPNVGIQASLAAGHAHTDAVLILEKVATTQPAFDFCVRIDNWEQDRHRA
jgi:hypothetical protein